MMTTHTYRKGDDVLLDGKAGYTMVRPGKTLHRIRAEDGASGLIPVDRVTPEFTPENATPYETHRGETY